MTALYAKNVNNIYVSVMTMSDIFIDFTKSYFIDGIRIRTKVYQCWCDMRQRVLNPNHKSYKNYGGRGITICQEWLDSFETFVCDVFPTGWVEGMSIDRIDSDGDYEPNNIRLATKLVQSVNRRLPKNNVTGFRGVILHQNRWRAGISVGNKFMYLGMFSSKELAALAYNIEAIKQYGNEARLNVIYKGEPYERKTDNR